MIKYPKKDWRRVGKKCFSVLKHGTTKTKRICRTVYAEKTRTPRQPIYYWFQLTPSNWTNTTRKGVTDGIVVGRRVFWRLKKTLKK